MTGRAVGIRAGAAALALLLGVATGFQAALDARERTSAPASVEAHHVDACVRIHDHRYCLLGGRSPWTLAPASAGLAAAPAARRVGSRAPRTRVPGRRPRAQPRPRSPPPARSG